VNYLFEVPAEAGGETGTSDPGASQRPPSPVTRLLIAHDSGWYNESSWEFLAGKTLDLVLLDCTGGAREMRRGHMSCAVVREFRDRLREQGSLAPGARVIATHFSHNGGWLHDQLEAYLNPSGIEVAYDGMRCRWGAPQPRAGPAER
jgi:hypothetical protein